MYVCCLLIHLRKFKGASEALEYFAKRRSDLTVSNKYQGVQTPSQARYVHYYAAMMAAADAAEEAAAIAQGSDAAAVAAGSPRIPPATLLHMPPKLKLQAIRIFGLPLGIDTLQISAQVKVYRCAYCALDAAPLPRARSLSLSGSLCTRTSSSLLSFLSFPFLCLFLCFFSSFPFFLQLRCAHSVHVAHRRAPFLPPPIQRATMSSAQIRALLAAASTRPARLGRAK